MERMDISDAGLDLIKKYEGFSPVPYICPAGKKTIGYGHVILPDESIENVDIPAATALLEKDVSYAESAICQAVNILLTQYEYDALCSFVYNLGGKAFLGSTLLVKLNDNDIPGAADEFCRWDHVNGQVSKGLANRREAERAMFLGNV